MAGTGKSSGVQGRWGHGGGGTDRNGVQSGKICSGSGKRIGCVETRRRRLLWKELEGCGEDVRKGFARRDELRGLFLGNVGRSRYRRLLA